MIRTSLADSYSKLGAQNLEHALDTFLTERAQAPQIGATNAHRAVAPMANALVISIPRRKPLSIRMDIFLIGPCCGSHLIYARDSPAGHATRLR